MFFNKKKTSSAAEPSPAKPVECEHKWQDFPWYIDGTSYSDFNNYYEIEIREPYVCVYCKKREDKVLWYIKRFGSSKQAQQIADNLHEQFKDKVKHRAEVEDMISDFQLIDTEYLRWFHFLNNTTDPSTSRNEPPKLEDVKLKL